MLKFAKLVKKFHFRQNIQTEISRHPVIRKSCNIACWNPMMRRVEWQSAHISRIDKY